MNTPNKYYQHKVQMSHLYNIYPFTIDLYKCMMIVERTEDKSSLKEMIARKENNEKTCN